MKSRRRAAERLASGHLWDVPLELKVEIGPKRITLEKLLTVRPGHVVALDRLAGEPVDVLLAGKLAAFGTIVVIDDELGVRITDIIGPDGATADEPRFGSSVGRAHWCNPTADGGADRAAARS